MSACIIVRSDDRLYLNSMFSLNQARGKLHDRHLAVAHTITADGCKLVGSIIDGTTYEQLHLFAKAQSISDYSLKHLLTELARCGALGHKKTNLRLAQRVGQAICIPSYIWRRDASLIAITTAIVRALWKICLSLAVMGVGVVLFGFVPLPKAIFISIWLVTILLCGAIAHEWAHVLFLKTRGVLVSVAQKGHRVGLLHQQVSPKFDGLCALLGPATGSSVTLLLAWLSQSATVLHFSFLLVLFHACSLLPNYGDGQSVARALRSYKRKNYDPTYSQH